MSQSSQKGEPYCQKCFQSGHWTYQCTNEGVYLSRPSRSRLLQRELREGGITRGKRVEVLDPLSEKKTSGNFVKLVITIPYHVTLLHCSF